MKLKLLIPAALFLIYLSVLGVAQAPSPTPIRRFPIYANDTAAGPCVSARKGYQYFRSSDNTQRICNGTSWGAAGGGGGITVGTTTSNGTANTLLKTDASGKANDATGLTNASGNPLIATAQAATDVPLTLKGAASQSANIFESKASDGTIGFYLTNPTAGFAFAGVGPTGNGSGVFFNSGLGVGLNHNFNTMFAAALHGRAFTTNGDAIRSIQADVSLTDATATTVATLPLATLNAAGGVLHVIIKATNGTDIQTRTQVVRFSAVNKGGVYTTDIAVVSEGVAVSVGTLTATWSITTGTNQIFIKVNADTSLASTTSFTATVMADSIAF